MNVVLEAQRLFSQVVKDGLHLLRFRLEAHSPRQALYELEELFAATTAHLAGWAYIQARHGRERDVNHDSVNRLEPSTGTKASTHFKW